MIRAIGHKIRAFLGRDESGSSTVEFVTVFPAFILIFLSGFEASMMLTRQVMLERSIDLAVRDLRLGTGTTITHGMIRNRVCSEAVVLPHCQQTLLIELIPVDTSTYAMPAVGQPCVDIPNNIAPVTAFGNGVSNQLMLVRACYVVQPFFPTSGFGLELTKDSGGLLYMTAATAYVNEPV